MARVHTEDERIPAGLHAVIEDTSRTADRLKRYLVAYQRLTAQVRS